MRNRERFLWIGALMLTLAGAAIAQSPQRWPGQLMGIADYQGNQFSSVNPFPMSGTVTSTPLTLTPVAASSALVSNQVLKGAAGSFFGAQVNTTTPAVWVMLFNAAALPGNGAVTPVAWWQVPANTTFSLQENPGLTLASGITLGCSTTGPFTLTASATCSFGAGAVQ